jgi:hypothetical protein
VRHDPRLGRALLALALPALTIPALTIPAMTIPALTIPALAAPAGTAPKGPQLPSVEQVAKIYPHLDGGTADVESSPVPALDEECQDGKPIKGSRLSIALYTPADPTSMATLTRKPIVITAALSFRSLRAAQGYYDDFADEASSCLGLDDLTGTPDGAEVTTKRIRFRLGDERSGGTTTLTHRKRTATSHVLLVREGRTLVLSVVIGRDNPAAKAVRLARTTLAAAL